MELSCPKCSTAYPESTRYCPECGIVLPRSTDSHSEPSSQGSPGASRIRRLLPHQYIQRLAASDGRLRSERRIVTTLFADIVDSTALAEALDPEDVTDIVNGAFRVMTEPIKRFDGTLARLMGDAILALFGAPIAHEDDPLRACRAALTILDGTQAYAAELQQRFGIRFQIRVGISTGLAVVGEVGTEERSEYTAIGDAVNLAARLQSHAAPGTAFIDGRTQDVICRTFATVDLGPKMFKGKKEAVHVYQLQCDAPVDATIDASHTDTPFVGRRDELAALAQWLARPTTGAGVTVLLTGEAGSGKTRLMAELQSTVTDTVRWVVGHGQRSMHDAQFGAARDVLLDLASRGLPDNEDLTEDKLRQRSNEYAGTTDHDPRQIAVPLLHLFNVALLPDEQQYWSQLSTEERGLRTHEAIVAGIAAEAQRSATVLIWDDAQWIDAPSLSVLSDLCRLTATIALAVVVMSREPVASLKSDSAQALHLAPLSDESSRMLLDSMTAPAALSPDVRDRILAVAEGNPLCLEEMARSMRDGVHALPSESPSAESVTGIPIPVQAAILARVDRLSEPERSILQTASVIGRAIQPDVLHLAVHPHIPLEDFTASLGRLERESFFVGGAVAQSSAPAYSRLGFSSAVRLAMPSMLKSSVGPGVSHPGIVPTLAFKHATAVEVIYQSLLRSERREIHRRIGTILESLFPDQQRRLAVTLAYHFGKGDQPAKELEYLIVSADRAFEVYAVPVALAQYDRALKIMRTRPETADRAQQVHVLMRLGDCHRLRGEYSPAQHAYDSALHLADSPVDRAMLHYYIGRVHERSRQMEKAQAAFETGIECLKDRVDERALAKLYLGLSGVLCRMGQLERGREIGDLASSVAQQGGDQRDEALANSNLAMCLAQQGDRPAARQAYADARVVFEAIGDRYSLAVLLNNLGCLSKDEEDWNDAIEMLTRSLELFTELGNQHAQAHAHNNLSDVYYLAGYEDRAHTHLEQAMAILATIGADSSGPIPEMWQSGTW